MHAEHEDGSPGTRFENFSCSDEAAHPGERTIHYDDARLQLLHLFHRFCAIATFSDDVDVGLIFENAAKSATHQGVIIDQQD
jgi:hypothetical protein